MKQLPYLVLTFFAVSCNSIKIKTNDSLSKYQSPLFYVKLLLQDWNQKHVETRDTIVIQISKRNEVLENLIMVVPKDNPVTVVTPKYCGKIGPTKAEFIVILTENCTQVS